jgi:general secretion pathway protein G
MSFFSRVMAALRRRVLRSRHMPQAVDCPRSWHGRECTRLHELGMTLIEIMVVVAIIGLMMGGVGVYAYGRWKKAQLARAKSDINNIKTALQQYGLDHKGECPKELKELFEQKLITNDPKDPWGQPFIFKCPGEHDTELGDVMSKGPDKKEGTEDDIKSWEDESSKAGGQ